MSPHHNDPDDPMRSLQERLGHPVGENELALRAHLGDPVYDELDDYAKTCRRLNVRSSEASAEAVEALAAWRTRKAEVAAVAVVLALAWSTFAMVRFW